MWRAVTQAVKLNALATGQPSGLAITHCLPLPLPAAPSPPCQAALMPLASSCQQMFVCGVAGRQLNRACILLAPGPLAEASLQGLCRSYVSTLREPQRREAQARLLQGRVALARWAGDSWKVEPGLSQAPSSSGNCFVHPPSSSQTHPGRLEFILPNADKDRNHGSVPREVTCGSLSVGIWTAGWTNRHSVNTVHLWRHPEV